ncbi:hypothetical protein CW304_25125 [Bacillus sp. UFRGS-B20]|nr:hypothetical protein CW304_25125 [Bacillus sp. UFRGS-B20]
MWDSFRNVHRKYFFLFSCRVFMYLERRILELSSVCFHVVCINYISLILYTSLNIFAPQYLEIPNSIQMSALNFLTGIHPTSQISSRWFYVVRNFYRKSRLVLSSPPPLWLLDFVDTIQ